MKQWHSVLSEGGEDEGDKNLVEKGLYFRNFS